MENHFNCIYMYTNKINGKRYVGQAINFNKRHRCHKNARTDKNNGEYNKPIHRALRKYGLDNFDVEILKENLNTQCLLNFYECYYIKKFDLLCKNGKGYNISDGGSNGNPFAGKTEEERREIRQKQSEAMRGENHPMYGNHHSEEVKQKMSESHKGENHPFYNKHLSEETKQKLSEAMKGENNPMYDNSHSEKSKQKISETRIKKELSKGENNPRAKRIAQYDKKTNELIKIWDYAKQASEELTINHSNIIKCCKGKYKSAGGYTIIDMSKWYKNNCD